MLYTPILEEMLPNCICGTIFQQCFKSIIHSVGEAILILSQINDKEMKNRYQVGKLLWSNLVNYAQESKTEIKDLVYKDILLIINELVNHIADKPMILDLILDVIVIDLPNFNKDIQIHREMILDLLFKLLSTPILPKIKKNHRKGLNCLLWECAKSKIGNEYSSNILDFLRQVLEKLIEINVEDKSTTIIPEIWCIIAEILIKYMEDTGKINEGNAAQHNFKTTEYVLKFPFKQILSKDLKEILEISEIWKKLYKQFDLQGDLIVTVKSNEILLNTIKMMQSCLNKDKDCSIFISYCLDILLSNINYNDLLARNEITCIMEYLIDLIKTHLNNSQFTNCDIVLKALSAVLITVYGYDKKKAILCLQYLRSVIEIVFISSAGISLKESGGLWETILIIIKGLDRSYRSEFLLLFKEVIIKSVNHSNMEIATHTLSFLQDENNFDDKGKSIIQEIHNRIKPDQLLFKLNDEKNKLEDKEKSVKQFKMAGSFLNRKSPSSKVAFTSVQKEKDEKRVSLPNPETQEYVYIKTDVKYDVNRLTEHQKEMLKKKRVDIPALYNDLSQSTSQSSQNLQEWFDKRVKHINEVDHVQNTRKDDTVTEENIDHDANKENTIDSTVTEYKVADKTDAISSTDLKTVQQSVSPVQSTSLVNENSTSDDLFKEQANTTSETSGLDKLEISCSNDSQEIYTHDEGSVAKRLDFESREEFPDNKESEQRLSPSILENGKRRNRNSTTKADINELNFDKTTGIQAEKSESKIIRRLRTKSIITKQKRGIKRKYASDSDSDELICQRRRKKYVSEIPSDTDSVKSLESENLDESKEEQLSQRTKNEMSRLKINMVFYSALTNRRRSKTEKVLEFDGETKTVRKSPDSKNSDETKSSVCGQSTFKKKSKKSLKFEGNKSEELNMIDSTKNSSEKETNKLDITEGSRSDESTNVLSEVTGSVNVDIQNETTDKDISPNVDKIKKKEMKESSMNRNENEKTKDCIIKDEALSCPEDGIEDIIQNSQEENTKSKLEGKYNDKKCFIKINKIDNIISASGMKSSNKDSVLTESTPVKKSTKEMPHVPRKISEDNTKIDGTSNIEDNTTEIVVNASSDHEISCIQHEDEKKTVLEASQVNNSPTNKLSTVVVSSPTTNINRLLKLKTYPNKGGRAAHMLGLVTKQIITESNSQSVKTDEDIMMVKKIKLNKDGENEAQIGKKDKTATFKDNDKIVGPCSSRQEKIFNNMKSGEYPFPSSSPVPLFSTLKNNGEKISPNVDKSIPDYMLISLDNVNEEGNDGSLSPSQKKSELPMLEWSNANPPSLTASPSASILKRKCFNLTESDLENTTPSKRKRVSFADPLVSKQMGYEIVITENPDKPNKLSSRIVLIRKNSPLRAKQTKLKFLPTDSDKEDKDIEMQQDNGCEVDLQCERENVLSTKMAEEMESTESMVIDDHTTCSISEDMNENSDTKLYTTVSLNNLSEELEMLGNKSSPKETSLLSSSLSSSVENGKVFQSQESETQQDMFGSIDVKNNIKQSENKDKDVNNINDSVNFSQLSIITNEDILEDTVDVGNITSFNTTTNLDEICCTKSLQTTSTQKLENITDHDTLTVTDSIFGSLSPSQASESSVTYSDPELLDDTKAFYGELVSCQDPINSLTSYLTYRSWTKQLNTYLTSRNIITIGDFAQLTAREINRMPIKNHINKIKFVKQVLDHYINKSLSKENSVKGLELNYDLSPISNDIESTTRYLQNKECEVLKQTESITNTKVNPSITEPSDINVSSQKSTIIDISMDDPNHTTRSIGVCTDSDLCPKPSSVATKSVEAQMALEDLLDEIDVNLVMQSAVKRSSPETILGHYKLKSRSLPEAEFEKETLRILGLNNTESYCEAKLKAVCRGCGVNKVLLRLPDIFSGDKKFFHKVLNAYRKKITIEDCMNVFNLKEIKNHVGEQYTSEELAAMLSVSLKKEEESGIKDPIRDLSCFSDILKRLPMDVIISHTVANDELIPPRLVLDIALQNSSMTDITETLKSQNSNLVQEVFNNLWSNELVLSRIEQTSEREELLKIYKAISSKLKPVELLDAYHESMKNTLSLDTTEK
ncbi:PREDICTED: telomere-associated protein RIF1-like [Polistes dominula]|uniref:Telomere-associated protein RIF1-like n=1 Tax=Polistes dominula TaxID=743375 RepID=A0ABM1HUJ7_POLDO|nr:PREDICTED: telomere-associated protein RIF1-like [Polistes dominula]